MGIKSQSSLTLVYPDESTTASLPDPTPFTPTANPTINSSFVAEPTQTGLAPDCQAFYKAVAVSLTRLSRPYLAPYLSPSLSLATHGLDCGVRICFLMRCQRLLAPQGDRCDKLLAEFQYITSEQLHAWNPSLGSDCAGMWEGYYHCVGSFASGGLPVPPTVTTSPSPVQTGISSIFRAWYMMTGGDTCASIVAMFGTMSEADLISWNPAVWDDCSEIKVSPFIPTGTNSDD